MGDFAWIKLLLRAIGVLLIGLGVPPMLSHLSTFMSFYSSVMAGPPGYFTPYLVSALGSGLQVGFGVYLLLGGKWITRRCLSDLQNSCLSCGYDVSRVPGCVCPECGMPFVRRGLDSSVPAETDDPEPHQRG